MTVYCDSEWTRIRLIVSFILFFILGFFFCELLEAHGQQPILHGFYYGNGSLYQVSNGGCDIDDETYNITGICDPDDNDTGEDP